MASFTSQSQMPASMDAGIFLTIQFSISLRRTLSKGLEAGYYVDGSMYFPREPALDRNQDLRTYQS